MSPVQEDRFEFGENWKSFLKLLDQERIDRAIDSLQEKLQIENFQDKRLLDLGCGSGLFSLAAHQMGADVVSIDFDPSSVQCTEELRKRFGNENKKWIIQRGSALDAGYMRSLGEFDIVYSWGVLHHTGDMNQAILLASERVIEGGRFMIAIYNDQGQVSIRWHRIKRLYHRFPKLLRPVLVLAVAGYYETKFGLSRILHVKNPLPFADWRAKKHDRGMSAWHDWVDWVGGLPFEVARPDRIIDPLKERGFEVTQVKMVGNGWGCNEYVFAKQPTEE